MKARLLLLVLASATGLFGTYAYDYTEWSGYNSSSWVSGQYPNGYIQYYTDDNGIELLQFVQSGGSVILTSPVSGNPNDYDVTSILSPDDIAGTYIHFLRANSTTVQSGTGSYISVELVTATGQLNINQCVNGVVTQLGSTSVTVGTGMYLRTVIWGTTLWVFTAPTTNPWSGSGAPPVWTKVWAQQVPLTTGYPGFGGYGMTTAYGAGFFQVQIGHHDTAPPVPVGETSILTSVFPNQVNFKWAPTTDNISPGVGTGVWQYTLSGNGQNILGSVVPNSFQATDDSAVPGTNYTYQIVATDYHGNSSTTSFTVTTPAAGAIDPRRTGVRPTGSYWGGGGEQIDTLSGNLNFSVPLVGALGRNGSTAPVGLTYNSQNWRQDGSGNWQLGSDVGYGFGWKIQYGSLTPYYLQWSSGVDHYIYTDSSGAEYPLTVNNGGVWSSASGNYVWFDSNANRLHFHDGSFWTMGCTSGGTEPDAGTMYPTVIEDVHGNQILISYAHAASILYPINQTDSSGRITGVSDSLGNGYGFGWNSDSPVPHLTGVSGGTTNMVMEYASTSLNPPFGTDPNYANVTTRHLAGMYDDNTGYQYQFTYDTAGAAELTQVTMPYGGHLRWTYANDQFNGGRTQRTVSGRYLAADSQGATEWSYPISQDNASSETVHSWMTLTDASGVGSKTWNFTTSGSNAWQIGLASEFVQTSGPGSSAILEDDTYTWSQDPAGNPYISSKLAVHDEGTSNQQSALSTQTLDQYGNVTQSLIYPFNNTATALQTWNNTFLNGSSYISQFILNRPVTSTVTVNGTMQTLFTNYYDSNCPSPREVNGISCWGTNEVTTGATSNFDRTGAVAWNEQGNLGFSVTPSLATDYSQYTDTGIVSYATRSDGRTLSQAVSSATNYSAPTAITTESYSQSIAYNTWLQVTQTTGANGEQLYMTYDNAGRPISGISPYGATTTYTYNVPVYSNGQYVASPPMVQTTTIDSSQAYTKKTMDGMGRTIRVEKGTHSGTTYTPVSWQDTVYAPCACSPLGKISKVSQPYTPNGTPAWTVYTYDGLGRTLSVEQPDGASTTTYAYSGNQTTVTDAAGKWKQMTSDVLGNLTTVVEPDPANPPSGTLTTSYAYDWMNHVTQVTMTRGSTTQTRTFVYNSAGLLTSATNPENGTVTYTYNPDNTLQYKQDAKGQQTVYTYDSTTKNVTMIQRFPAGQNNAEDMCQRVTYTWGGGAPGVNRIYQLVYGNGYTCAGGLANYFSETYQYTAAGAVTSKKWSVSQSGTDVNGNPFSWSNYLTAQYSYNTEGRLSTVSYPLYGLSGNYNTSWYFPSYMTYGFDAMGRPSTLSVYPNNSAGTTTDWVQNATYDVAGRMNSLQYLTGLSDDGQGDVSSSYTTETMGYNANGQLSSLSWSGSSPSLSGVLTYGYSGTQNNGQITQMTDTLSGETIVYQYDALKRLTSASSTPINGSSPAAWTQTFQYDGFGNLTAKVLNGTTNSIGVNAATNQLSSAYYDLNGNMTSGAGATFTYDEANRMVSAAETSGGTEYYQYAPDNKRVFRLMASGTEEFTFWGAMGEKLAVLHAPIGSGWQFVSGNVYFAGKRVWEGGGAVFQDREGTNRAMSARFYPFGDEITSTSNDRLKFATYTRDSYTGLDYADQRFYASTYGRFNTTDLADAKPHNPMSWNRYSYTRGDPINRNDPRGLDPCPIYASADGCDDGSGNPCDPGSAVYDPSLCPDNSNDSTVSSIPTCLISAFNPVPDPSCYSITPITPVATAIEGVTPLCNPGFLPANGLYTDSEGATLSGADIDYAARAVYAESNGSVQGDQAVASVIYNRLGNPQFGSPSTLTQVVSAPCQFAAVAPCAVAAGGGGPNVPFTQSQPGNYQNLSGAECASLSTAIQQMVAAAMVGPAYQFTSFRAVGSTTHPGTVIGGNIFW